MTGALHFYLIDNFLTRAAEKYRTNTETILIILKLITGRKENEEIILNKS